MSASLSLRMRAAAHEIRCFECRVTWRSWAQRLLNIAVGYAPKLSPEQIARGKKRIAARALRKYGDRPTLPREDTP